MMSFYESLAIRSESDKYFKSLMYELDSCYAMQKLSRKNIISMDRKKADHLIRFADILSRSSVARHKNSAVRIVSLLHSIGIDDEYFKSVSASVFTQVGLFPSIDIVNAEINDYETAANYFFKKTLQTPDGADYALTDAQYDILNKLKNSNHYSFSAPTSFGKSFVIESFIRHIIKERNAVDNIAILVPTRALINQVSAKIKQEIKNESYEVISYPEVPLIFQTKNKKYIFVFTAERLISYFGDSKNPSIDYLFVDEAHKLLSDDSRTPILYHALAQANRKSVKIYFASPNIKNADVFLKLFGSSSDESSSVQDIAVTQNRFFIDTIEGKSVMFSEYGEAIEERNDYYREMSYERLKAVLEDIGSGDQNIIYCNSTYNTIDLARGFSAELEIAKSGKLLEFAKYIKDHIHDEYFLADCVTKGVGFHFGGMPQQIRHKVEELFRNGELQYLFCTSTLLEGVNLPAKNIFILSEKNGLKKMSGVDFWNLAGRAGRFTKDVSGNVYCCRVLDKNGYWSEGSGSAGVLLTKNLNSVDPLLMRRANGNLYKNINNFLNKQDYTTKALNEGKDVERRKSIESYASILAWQHSVDSGNSVLKDMFVRENKEDAFKTLAGIKREIKIPADILAQSVNIRVDIQNNIYVSENIELLPEKVDYEACLSLLKILEKSYRWHETESGGHNPLARKGDYLKYYAVIMYHWITSKPLNYIIGETINYYEKGHRNIQISKDQRPEWFNGSDARHINALINNLMQDIENVLRFKIKNYIKNYCDILQSRSNSQSMRPWYDYLEYGTVKKEVIEIQKIGTSRSAALILAEKHIDCFEFNEGSGEIVNINKERLIESMDKESHKEEYDEMVALFKLDRGDEKG